MPLSSFHRPVFRPSAAQGARRLVHTLIGLALSALVGCGVARDESEPASPAPTVEERAETAKSKAEALEEKASSESDGARPSPGELITRAEAQAVDPKGKESLDDAITCLARSVYWEARGESQAAMEAVASVVMNRLGHSGFPDTVCGVVKGGRETGTCQFSWWCDGRPDTAQETEGYELAKEVARKALNRQLADRTQGATYFHHKRVRPAWSKIFTRTTTVGGHRFYKPNEPEKPRSEAATSK